MDTRHNTDKGTVIDLSHTLVTLRNDRIIEVQCGEDFYYEASHIREIVDTYGRLIGNSKVPVLILGGNYTSLSPAARRYSASPEASRFSLAEAFVIKTLAQKILANFYTKVDKPAVPTRFFTDKATALHWLGKYL